MGETTPVIHTYVSIDILYIYNILIQVGHG